MSEIIEQISATATQEAFEKQRHSDIIDYPSDRTSDIESDEEMEFKVPKTKIKLHKK